MSQAFFEGKKQYVPVVPHLDGLSAVGNLTKLAYHMVEALTILIPYLIIVIVTIVDENTPRGSSATAVAGIFAMIAVLTLVALPIVNLIFVLAQGRTLAMALLSVRAVDVRTGATAKGALFLKLLLAWIVAYFSLGIAYVVISFASQDELGRTWFDRTAGTMMVSTSRGRDPHKVPIAFTPAPVGYPPSVPMTPSAGAHPSVPDESTSTVIADPTQPYEQRSEL